MPDDIKTRLPLEGTLPVCDYCGSAAKLVDGTVIYPHRPDLAHLKFWKCPNTCNAYVGCHPNTNVPLGRLATAELRTAKSNTHYVFDQLWKKERGGTMKRSEAYAWLAARMGLPVDECHVGMFTLEQCYKATKVCQEEVEKRE